MFISQEDEEKMFTRMSKVVLWIAAIAIFIGGAATLSYDGLGLLIWLGGLILLWGIGVFVEMVNNIMDIKIMLSKGGFNNQTPHQNIQKPIQVNNFVEDKGKWYCRRCNSENSSDDVKCVSCGASSDGRIGTPNTSYNLSQIAQQTEIQNENAVGWFCRACGQKNSSNSQYCSACGKYR